MAIALVKAGALSEAAAATVTPAFGQATTAGNCLIAFVGWSGNSVSATTATGWVKDVEFLQTGSSAAIWHRPNCDASETAPTFTAASATQMTTVLTEWSGIATTSPLDKTSGGAGNTNTAQDTNTSDVAVYVQYIACTKSCTAIYSNSGWSPSGGTPVAIVDDGSTKQSTHFIAEAYLLAGFGGGGPGNADSTGNSDILSTGTGRNAPVIASFLPEPIVPYYPYDRFDTRRRGKSPMHRATW